MRRIAKRAICLTLSLVLSLSLCVPARAASGRYLALPGGGAWSEGMTQAAAYGLFSDFGSGELALDQYLSWGRFLAFAARAFAPDGYLGAIAAGESRDGAAFTALSDAGILTAAFPVTRDSLDAPVNRQDMCLLLYNALPEDSYRWTAETGYAPEFSDFAEMFPERQQAVAALWWYDGVSAKADGRFGWADSVTWDDAATALMPVLRQINNHAQRHKMTVTCRFVNAVTGEAIAPDRTEEVYSGSWLSAGRSNIGYFKPLYDYNPSYVSPSCREYTLYFRPMTKPEQWQLDFETEVSWGLKSWEDEWWQDYNRYVMGENDRKHLLLFGDRDKRRYSSRDEAALYMTTVTVPMWRIDRKGSKYASSGSFTINAALAQDVVEIFTEIFNDPEQFPIHDIGGYGWRGDSATGEHNCGSAIDVNSNENYQIRYGNVEAGSLWQPGVNPYSITPGGSVVRIFEEHGWTWGGDAWAGSSDPSDGYHDYMHFSYMGW